MAKKSSKLDALIIEAQYRQGTISIVQTLLDVDDYASDPTTIRKCAVNAGLWPLKPGDRAILKESIGKERLTRFIRICKTK